MSQGTSLRSWAGRLLTALLVLGWAVATAAVGAPAAAAITPFEVRSPVPAARGWFERSALPSARVNPACSYDSRRARFVLFGGYTGSNSNQTWEWNGESWLQRAPATSPGVRTEASAVYDSFRGRVVLFGGANGSALADTWEYDGLNWLQRSLATAPGVRSQAGFAYDSLRRRAVLFGGFSGSATLDDTWEYDGANWHAMSPANKPSIRANLAMVYDSARQRVVLYGGSNGSSTYNDTWEWDGSDWTQKTDGPAARRLVALAYDSRRGVTVLHGGTDTSTAHNETWEYDGSAWSQRTPATLPGVLSALGSAYDSARGKVVIFGGSSSLTISGSFKAGTWEYDGTNWVRRTPDTFTTPTARRSGAQAMAYDAARSRSYLYGGYTSGFINESWTWDGLNWTQHTVATNPGNRADHVMVYEPSISKVFLFGGSTGSSDPNSVHEYDGTAWSSVSPATRPSGREFPAIAYDSARDQVIMFGGNVSGRLNDTWEWDPAGQSWQQKSPATPPSVRWLHSMTWDAARQVAVMFGGSGSAWFNDTWEYAPVSDSWTQRTTDGAASSPSKRGYGPLVHDPVRNRSLLFSGLNSSNVPQNDAWEWDGTNWTQLSLSTLPPGRGIGMMSYDTSRKRMVLFGGFNGSANLGDTWELPSNSPPSMAEAAFTESAATLFVGESVAFTASSTDADGDALTYRWTAAGPGSFTTSTSSAVQFTPTTVGTYLVQVAVSDGNGGHAQALVNLTVQPAPTLMTQSVRVPPVVQRGQPRIPVQVSVRNDGSSTANVTAAGLRFTSASGADISTHFAVYSLPANPASIAAGATATFTLQAGVAFACETGTVSVDATFTATDASTGASVSTTPGSSSAAWAVGSPRVSTQPLVWKQLSLATTPGPRSDHPATYDEARGVTVIFGGSYNGTYYNDTWEFDGVAWTKVTADGVSGSPARRSAHKSAYDPYTGSTLLFGGNGLNDTWSWKGSAWTQLTVDGASGSPSGRLAHTMSFDRVRRRAVIVGGSPGTTNDTWEFDGTTWSQRTLNGDSASPPVRHSGGMAWMPDRNVLRLFAGGNNGSPFRNDLWDWNGTSWTNVTPATKPSARERMAFVHDAARSRFLMYAGTNSFTSNASDTWTLEGTAWTDLGLTTNPGGREGHAFAYDPRGQRLLINAGYNRGSNTYYSDTWVLVADEAQPSIFSVAAPSSVTGSFVATMTVRNTGAHAATLTTAGLRIYDPSGADVTGRFAIVARAGNPTSVAALTGTAALQFDVSPRLGTSGVHSIDAVLSANDSSTAADVSPTGGAETVAYSLLSIPSAPILSFGSLTAPATVSRGQVFSASLDVTNAGDAAAEVTSTALVFTGSGLTAAPRGTNPSAVATGTTTSFVFEVTAGSDASTGPQTATFVLQASNQFNGADASRAVSLAPTVTVQTSPAFAVSALTAPSPVSQGQTFAATLVVSNTGEAAADLTATALSFTGSGVTVSAWPSNPTSLAGGEAGTFTYDVTASSHASTGLQTPTLTVEARDRNSGADASASTTVAPGVVVQTPAALAFATLAAPSPVSQGQAFTASIDVSNPGQATAYVRATLLAFSGTGLTASAHATNPTSVAGGATATFSYDVTAVSTASTGAQTATLAMDARDRNSNFDVSASSAVSPAITVQTVPALAFGPLESPASVSQGQTFVATVVVTNTGDATADLTATSLAFGGSGLTASGRATNPTSLAGGAEGSFTYDVTVASTATTGLQTPTLTVEAKDRNAGFDASAASAVSTGVTVQTLPSLAFGSLTAPSPVSRGQVFSASIDLTNTGEATADVRSTSLSFSGTGLNVSARASNPTSLAGGASGTFTYEVTAASSASTGLQTPTLAVDARDRNSDFDVGASATVSSGIVVHTVPSFAFGTLAAPSPVSRGQTFVATVGVNNTGDATADLTATWLSFGGGGLTVSAWPSNPTSLAGGASGTFTYDVIATSSATTGLQTPSLAIEAKDRNSSHDASASSTLTPSVMVQTVPSFVFGTLTAPSPVSQGQAFSASIDLTNTGGATADLTATWLGFGTRDVTASVRGTNPTSLAGGATGTFTYDVTAMSSAPTGALTPSLSIEARDRNTGSDASALSVLTPSLSVQTPAALSAGDLVVPALVSQGQGFTANIVLSNTGEATAEVTSTALGFSGSGLTAVPSPGNPTSVAGLTTATFSYEVSVSSTAGTGGRTASLTVDARDANSLVDLDSTQPVFPGLTVQTGPTLVARTFSVPGSVSQGQSFEARVEVANTGQALASISSAVLSFNGSGLTATPSSGNPSTIPGNAMVTFTYDVSAAVEAATGSRTATIALTARDANSGADVGLTRQLSPFVNVLRPGELAFGALEAPSTVSQGQVFTAAVVVSNPGGSTADITSTALSFSSAGMTATPSSSNPDSVAGGTTATLSYEVSVSPTATAGVQMATLAVSAKDRISGVDTSSTQALSPTVIVQVAASLSFGALAVPSSISLGQTFGANVVVTNTGEARAAIAAAVLSFSGAGVTVTPSAASPVSVAGGASATFSYDVTAGSASSTGVLTAVLAVTARDGNSGSDVSVTQALAPGLTVQRPAALSLGNLSAPTEVSQGQSFRASVVVSNTGEALATVQASSLTFGGDGLSVTSVAGNPASLAGGATATFAYDVSVSPAAAAGSRTATLSLTARDTNSGADASLSQALTPAVALRVRAHLSAGRFMAPATVSQGQTFVASAEVSNPGEAAAELSSIALAFSGEGLTVTPIPGAVSSLAGGATATFGFSVAVEPAAPTGARTASLDVAATDRVSGAAAGASLAMQPGVIVQSPPRFGPGTLVAPSSVPRPSSFTAMAIVTNTGGATAGLDSASLSFSTSGLVAVPAGDNPTSVAGGATATFRFTVNVAADATGGDSLASLGFTAIDRNSLLPGVADLSLTPGLFVRVNSAPAASLTTAVFRVTLGGSVALTGVATDPDPGDLLVYGWSVESRPGSSLATAGSFRPNDSPAASLTTFTPDVQGSYVVSLVVFDGTTLSAPVLASIEVERPRPVASIEASTVATLHLPVRLEGGNSHDPLGSVLAYRWSVLSKPATSTLTEGALQPNNSSLASFTRFCPDRKGDFIVGLVVSAGSVESEIATAAVPVSGVPPTVAVMPASPVLAGSPATLVATVLTEEAGQTPSFHWSIESGPEGAVASFVPNDSADAVQTQFTSATPGKYKLAVTASDGVDVSNPAATTLFVVNPNPPVRPTVRIKNNGKRRQPRVAKLGGGLSKSGNGRAKSYYWELVNRPTGIRPFVATKKQINYLMRVAGSYTFRLTVFNTDFGAGSAELTLVAPAARPRAAVRNPRKVVSRRAIRRKSAGYLNSLDQGDGSAPVQFDGTLSKDLGGRELAYSWKITSAPDTNPGGDGGDDSAKQETVLSAADVTTASTTPAVPTTLARLSSTDGPRPELILTGPESMGNYTVELTVGPKDEPAGKGGSLAGFDAIINLFRSIPASFFAAPPVVDLIKPEAGANRLVGVEFDGKGGILPSVKDPILRRKTGFIRLQGGIKSNPKHLQVIYAEWFLVSAPEGSRVKGVQFDQGTSRRNVRIPRMAHAPTDSLARTFKPIFVPDLPGDYIFKFRIGFVAPSPENEAVDRTVESPFVQVRIRVKPVKLAIEPKAQLVALSDGFPKIVVKPEDGRRLVPYDAAISLVGRILGRSVNAPIGRWTQLEGPFTPLETDKAIQTFEPPDEPGPEREPGNYTFRFTAKVNEADPGSFEDVAISILPPPGADRPAPVCFEKDGSLRPAQIDPSTVGLSLAATASTTPAVGSDFSDSDTGEQPGSLEVGLPTVVTLTGTLLGSENLAYAAYDYLWEQVDGPDATLSKYVDSATPRTSSFATFEPTTAGLYEFELRVSPRDENDLAVDLQFIRRIRVKVTSPGLRAPTAQAFSSQATVPGTGPAEGRSVVLSAAIGGLAGPANSATVATTGGDFEPEGLEFNWTQISGPSCELSDPDSSRTTVQLPDISGERTDQTYVFEFTVTGAPGGDSEPARVTVTQRAPEAGQPPLQLVQLFLEGEPATDPMFATTGAIALNFEVPPEMEDGDVLTVESVNEQGESVNPATPLRSLLVMLRDEGSEQVVSDRDGVLLLSRSTLGTTVPASFSELRPTAAPGAVTVGGPVGGGGGGGGCRMVTALTGSGRVPNLLVMFAPFCYLFLRRRRRA